MTFICLWSPDWSTAGAALAELAAPLLEEVPRVATEARGVIWADGRGLPAPRLAWALRDRLDPERRGRVRTGVAAVAVAAEVAARSGDAPVTLVESGYERDFLAPRPLSLLEPGATLRTLLRELGIEHCGQLAALERGAVEVRLGTEGVALWRRARADDPRRIFSAPPTPRPSAALEFLDYDVRSSGALVFAANALLGNLCGALAGRGERASQLTLELPLSGGGALRHPIRSARPTADRAVWLRRVRSVLDRLLLPDAVTGIRLQVESTEAASASQGDFFDRGFQSAAAAEAAAAQLTDTLDIRFLEPEHSRHALPERRTNWTEAELAALAESRTEDASREVVPVLALHLLPTPRRIAVRVAPRRDHGLPTHYCDARAWRTLTTATGPYRISGGQWEEHPFVREYFRCTTEAGALVWLYYEVAEDAWYLHGWWD